MYETPAKKILDLAEKQGLLDAKVIADLRKQVAESRFVVTPEALAKVLVDHEHLTPFQARKLVSAALEEPAPARSTPAPSTPAARPVAPSAVTDDLLLGFADESGFPATKAPASAPAAPPEEDIVMLEAVEPAAPARPKPAATPPAAAPSKPAPQPVAAKPKAPSPARPSKPAAAPLPPSRPEEDIFELDPVPASSPGTPQPTAFAPGQRWTGSPAPPAASPPLGAEGLEPLTPLPAGAAATAAPPKVDDLLGDSLGAAADPLAAGSSLLAPPPPAAKVRRNVWDSPLLLIGGGILGVLIIAFGLLVYAFTRGSASELFAKAEGEYRSGSYTSAIAGYDLFLQKYPSDASAGLARVRRGMAQLRQVADDGKNPRQSLATAKEVLPQIENEEKFADARIELSTILPDIADGFAQQAVEAADTAKKEELVEQAEEALELVNNPAYLPASLRKDREGRIAGILDRLKLAQRSIAQNKDLVAALDKIKAAESQGNARQAYEIRKQLLKVYPGLDVNAELVAAIRRVGEKEQSLVQVGTESAAAGTDDPQAAGKRLVLSMREGPAAGTVEQVVYVLVEGAAYGLDVASGKVLWRRHVGYETTIPPTALGRERLADALVVDSRQHELLRLEAATGKLVWRFPVGQPFFPPVVSGKTIFVTARDGRVLQLAAADGTCVRTAQLPQGASVAVGLDNRGSRLIQLGEHSTLFVLAADGLACEETYYLGHERGAILVPPTVVLDTVLAIESPADDHSLVHVLARTGEKKQLAEVGKPFRLAGRVVVPPVVVGRRIVVVTDIGQIDVYDVDTADAKEPVRRIAQSAASEREAMRIYTTADASRLWLAGRRCSLFEIQASLQKISRKWALHQDDTFVAPLQTFGETLVHVRRRKGLPCVSVEGCRADDGSTLWRTDLAVPVAALVAADSRKAVDAITQQGRVFTISSDQLKAGYVDAPAFALPRESRGAIFPEIDRPGLAAQAAWTETQPGGRAFVYDIAAAGAPASKALPSADLTAATAGALWKGQVIVPTTSGTVALVSVVAGAETLPFMPPLEPDNLPVWTRPAVLKDQSGFVIADGKGMLYRVGIKTDAAGGGSGQPYLAAMLEKPTEHRFHGSLVTLGDTLYGLSRGDAADAVVAINPQTLTAEATWPIAGRAQIGPALAGGAVFVSSEADGLYCLDGNGQLRWKAPLAHGPLTGPPVPCEGDFLLIAQSGRIGRIAGDTGAEIAATDVAELLGAAGQVVGPQLFVATSDGAVIMVPVPKPQ